MATLSVRVEFDLETSVDAGWMVSTAIGLGESYVMIVIHRSIHLRTLKRAAAY